MIKAFGVRTTARLGVFSGKRESYMKIMEETPGVFTSNDQIVAVARDLIETLKNAAYRSPQKRARFCAHPNNSSPIHEMLIALARDTYVCPHKHPGKSESFHVIDGQANVIIFEDNGVISRIIPLGDYNSGLSFFYRISSAYYHTLVVRSEFLIIHETTNGPFHKDDCQFAPWAPKENELTRWPGYLSSLRNRLR